MENAVRSKLDRLLVAATVIAPVLCLLAARWALEETGSWGAVQFFVLYALPLFVIAPIWARTRLAIVATLTWFTLATDAIVLMLSVARFAASEVFPFSGHMLFLTYTLLTSRSARYRWFAAALIVETSVFKSLWHDARSWAIGLALGLGSAAIVVVPTAVLGTRGRREG